MARATTSPLLIAASAVFLGALVDAFVKAIAEHTSVLSIVGWRFLFGALYAVTLFRLFRRPFPGWRAIRFHGFRGAIQLSSALAFFWALTQLGLAEATTIGFTAALMVAPIAWPVLGERINMVAAGAAAVGFAGAAFAVSAEATGAPPDGDRLLGAAAALFAAFGYAMTIVLLRLRTRQEDALTIVMFTNVWPAVLMAPILLATQPAPSLEMLPAFAILGAAGMAVWWMMTLAYGRAPAQNLAPLEYTALIWSSALGFALFDEAPSWRLYAGAGLIIAACLVIAAESRLAARRRADPSAGGLD